VGVRCVALLLLAALLLMPPALPGLAAEHRVAPARGSQTGLPVPRFVSLKASVANLRVGPGLRYPIAWVFHRRHLPVEILREFGNWRLIRTSDGTKGWTHMALLSGRRSFIVTSRGCVLRRAPGARARPEARLQRGVVGQLEGCPANAGWCRAAVAGYRGYVRRQDIWGSLSK
jgi:SH3-like domain-containing protein